MADERTIRTRERNAGLLLIAAAAAALVAANSPLADAYHHLLETRVGPILPRIGQPSLHQWIADGLMAIFFLLVGLEVKREWFDGQLASSAQRRLPIVAAVAGMAVPALVYLVATGFDPALIRGWAIPSATDIAFAVGILALLGTRSSPALKLLLVTIAIVDDIGAVIIIALAYSAGLDGVGLAAAGAITLAMAGLNRAGIRALWPYLIGFAGLWVAMLASGVHPTIAGVLAAFTIPFRHDGGASPLKRLEHALHPWVSFLVMPLFGLASAGVHFDGIGGLLAPLPLAIAAGLFVGKQAGVLGALWIAVRTGFCSRPEGAGWRHLHGAALLCGVGFTMSLFIGALAFPDRPDLAEQARMGTLAGSLLSALAGWAVLRTAPPMPATPDAEAEARELFADDQDDA